MNVHGLNPEMKEYEAYNKKNEYYTASLKSD